MNEANRWSQHDSFMPSVIDHHEDILTTMVELKSEGDGSSKSELPHMESIDFIIFLVIGLPCDVAFDRYISAAHVLYCHM